MPAIDATSLSSGRSVYTRQASMLDGGPADELARHPDDRGVRTADASGRSDALGASGIDGVRVSQFTDREPFILPPGQGNLRFASRRR
jgi:hypothetical protein